MKTDKSILVERIRKEFLPYPYVTVDYREGVKISLYEMEYKTNTLIQLRDILNQILETPELAQSVSSSYTVGYYDSIDDIYLRFGWEL